MPSQERGTDVERRQLPLPRTENHLSPILRQRGITGRFPDVKIFETEHHKPRLRLHSIFHISDLLCAIGRLPSQPSASHDCLLRDSSLGNLADRVNPCSNLLMLGLRLKVD